MTHADSTEKTIGFLLAARENSDEIKSGISVAAGSAEPSVAFRLIFLVMLAEANKILSETDWRQVASFFSTQQEGAQA